MRKCKGVQFIEWYTANQSESFNTVLKQYQHWKEVPIDSFVHGLYFYCLQMYYYNEVQKGYNGLGDYHLKLQFFFYYSHQR